MSPRFMSVYRSFPSVVSASSARIYTPSSRSLKVSVPFLYRANTGWSSLWLYLKLEGLAEFSVPEGRYVARCECTPSHAFPSREEFELLVCRGECRTVNFACPLASNVFNENFVINNNGGERVAVRNFE